MKQNNNVRECINNHNNKNRTHKDIYKYKLYEDKYNEKRRGFIYTEKRGIQHNWTTVIVSFMTRPFLFCHSLFSYLVCRDESSLMVDGQNDAEQVVCRSPGAMTSL